MNLDVSPDLDALACYVIVLGIGVLAALYQLSQKLGGYRGAWVMFETWALFSTYALIPVGLYWLLDRTNAIHDTSLFAALIVGLASQQILAGQLSTVKVPSEALSFWQFFSAWSDRMSTRVRDRMLRNVARFRDTTIAAVVEKALVENGLKATLTKAEFEALHKASRRYYKQVGDEYILDIEPPFERLRELAMAGTVKPAELVSQLADVNARSEELGQRGVLEQQVKVLYEAVSNLQDYRYQLKERQIITSFTYYWNAQEWRSKMAAILIGTVLIIIAIVGYKYTGDRYIQPYYIWRLQKVNATSLDRFRTREALLRLLSKCPDEVMYSRLVATLQRDTLSPEIIGRTADLFIESEPSGRTCGSDPAALMVGGLWNSNPDARARIQDALVYIGSLKKVELLQELK